MPYFYGDNPACWIHQCGRYFKLSSTPEYLKVKIATAYITGHDDTWLRGSGIILQQPLPSWSQFCVMVTNRFGEISSFDAMEQFQALQQVSSVAQYIDQFEESMVLLKKDNPYLEEAFFIASFVRGLKTDIKHLVKYHQPKKLLDAYWYARQLEQVEPPKKLQVTLPGNRPSLNRNGGWKTSSSDKTFSPQSPQRE